jgi:hypothetical protein
MPTVGEQLTADFGRPELRATPVSSSYSTLEETRSIIVSLTSIVEPTKSPALPSPSADDRRPQMRDARLELVVETGHRAQQMRGAPVARWRAIACDVA